MAVVLVTDSSASIPPATAHELGIHVAPLHVLVGDRDLRDGIDDIPSDLSSATTSGAAPGELEEVYGRALEASGGDGVLAVHLSRQLSGTWKAGTVAADAFAGQVRLVDSRAVALGLGFPVVAAARAARAGMGIDDLFDRTVAHLTESRVFVTVDRLDQLRRGGRIGTAAALLGTALSMKPVLHLDDGRLQLLEKTRTSTKALAKMIDRVVAAVHERPVSLAVQHVLGDEHADFVADELRTRVGTAVDLVVCDIGAVLAAHVGAGAVGVAVSPEPTD
ncbi:DegV family protein [Rhodococcus sp. HNM0569]|uniref:DegV family protein n=1 Tax=Rhodococcus sp. HNM0569 TaxID=2716340 RepID=UPI00146A5678|nr:DegV family protein [Rhodococcus sp. HNM0569]NLU84046.1 DegV family protein [Rhodococcus sp. HNM0569]